MNPKELDITDLKSLNEAVNEVLEILAGTPEGRAGILALHGDLGAGKTTFTQLLADSLGVKESVTSPTFVIMKKYDTADKRWQHLVHVDAYRLDSSKELSVIGLEQEFNQSNNIISIEWAEKVAELLPRKVISLYFSLIGDTRYLKIEYEK